MANNLVVIDFDPVQINVDIAPRRGEDPRQNDSANDGSKDRAKPRYAYVFEVHRFSLAQFIEQEF
jgi:hypothetical protein